MIIAGIKHLLILKICFSKRGITIQDIVDKKYKSSYVFEILSSLNIYLNVIIRFKILLVIKLRPLAV